MPRKRKTARRQRNLDQLRIYLMSGRDMFNDLRGQEPTLAELQEGWDRYRGELMARENPCRRPWGWWRFEAPKNARELHFDGPYMVRQAVILKRFKLLRRAELAAMRRDVKERWAMRKETRMEEQGNDRTDIDGPGTTPTGGAGAQLP